MSWLIHKMDALAGAVFGAVLGAAASQGQAFTAAYLQRLGGRLDEAAMVLAQARDGTLLPDASAATREQLVTEFAARVQYLEGLRDSLLAVSPLWRPFALIGQMETEIAANTLDSFVPALPLTLATAVHAGLGLLLGLLLWECCKAPAIVLRRRRRHRQRPRPMPQRRREPSFTTVSREGQE